MAIRAGNPCWKRWVLPTEHELIDDAAATPRHRPADHPGADGGRARERAHDRRVERGRLALRPDYAEFGIDASAIPAGPGRTPFGADAADILSEFKPAVVSFHFGLPSPELLARVRALGAKIFSSATTE